MKDNVSEVEMDDTLLCCCLFVVFGRRSFISNCSDFDIRGNRDNNDDFVKWLVLNVVVKIE